jgi:hypothetical protein
MNNRSRLGVLGLVTVAVLALIFGALGGYVAGKTRLPAPQLFAKLQYRAAIAVIRRVR